MAAAILTGLHKLTYYVIDVPFCSDLISPLGLTNVGNIFSPLTITALHSIQDGSCSNEKLSLIQLLHPSVSQTHTFVFSSGIGSSCFLRLYIIIIPLLKKKNRLDINRQGSSL